MGVFVRREPRQEAPSGPVNIRIVHSYKQDVPPGPHSGISFRRRRRILFIANPASTRFKAPAGPPASRKGAINLRSNISKSRPLGKLS